MSTIYYVGGKGNINEIGEDNGISALPVFENFTERIKKIFEKVRFSFSGVLDTEGVVKTKHLEILFGEDNNQDDTHALEILKDHNSTFTLFEKAIHAARNELIHGNKILVDIYIKDLSNTEFLKTMRQVRNQGVVTQLIVINIRPDDYGILESRAIENLGKVYRLGFEFTMSDFVIDGEDLRADNLIKVFKEQIFPSSIKIAKNVFEKIKSGHIKISNAISKLLESIYKKGIKIVLVSEKKEINKENTNTLKLPFFESSTLISEDILGIDGQLFAQEGLIRFGDNMQVSEGLQVLQNLGSVGLLTDKVIHDSLLIFENGIPRSINVYIKEIGQDDFLHKIHRIMQKTSKFQRKDFIIEILEVKYGAFNNKVLDNLRYLQRNGFKIAIDDLSLCYNNSSMSLETFEILFEEKIIPDYIKIDGIYSEEILQGKITDYHLHYLREIIGLISLFPKIPIIIFEWVQDTEHALIIEKLLRIEGVYFLYQGRSIKYGNFGYSLLKNSIK